MFIISINCTKLSFLDDFIFDYHVKQNEDNRTQFVIHTFSEPLQYLAMAHAVAHEMCGSHTWCNF